MEEAKIQAASVAKRRGRILTVIGAAILFVIFIVKNSYRDSLKDIVDAQNTYQSMDILRRLDGRVAEIEKATAPSSVYSQTNQIPFNTDTVWARLESLSRLVKTIPGHAEDKGRFENMKAVISSLPKTGQWSALDEAEYGSAMLNGISDQQLINDAEQERSAREERLRICTVISFILYPIGWILVLVGKLYDLPGVEAPKL